MNEFNNKCYFVGISLSPSSTADTGIAVIDKDLNLLRVDKTYTIEEIPAYINSLAPLDNMLICVDLPRNTTMISGKWRIEAKHNKVLSKSGFNSSDYSWTERFSDRGAEVIKNLTGMGVCVYRYYGYFAKNVLKLNPPYKSRSSAACKYLQLIIKNNLNISGIPSNLIALSGLDAMVGAYTAWKIASSQEGEGYKCIGNYKNVPIITPV